MTDEMADGNDGMPELDDISQLGKKVTKHFGTRKKKVDKLKQECKF